MATEIVVSLVGGGFAVVVALISKIGTTTKKTTALCTNPWVE
jgi:hypothetical protein